jgi:hypothetical protein
MFHVQQLLIHHLYLYGGVSVTDLIFFYAIVDRFFIDKKLFSNSKGLK